jgi:hypothetical protein
MEIRFEPTLLYYLNTNHELYFKDVKTLKGMINTIIPSGFNFSISSDIENYQLFNTMSMKGKPFDVICDMAANYGFEVYCSGKSIGLGYITSKEVDPLKLENISWFNNSIGVYELHGTKFASVTTADPHYIPGGWIKVNGIAKRIIYNRIYIGPTIGAEKYKVSTEQTVVVENTVIVVDDKEIITEEMLFDALPEEDRVYARHIKPYYHSSFVGLTKSDDDSRKEIYPNIISDDLSNVAVFKGDTLNVIKSSPYAGDQVGLQFPAQQDSIDLITLHKDNYHAGVTHSQLWSDNIPKKNNPEDFRLTLPDGGTLYYDKAKGKWILAAKSQIIIGIDSGTKYDAISFDSTSGKIVITDGTRTITMNGSTVDVS